MFFFLHNKTKTEHFVVSFRLSFGRNKEQENDKRKMINRSDFRQEIRERKTNANDHACCALIQPKP